MAAEEVELDVRFRGYRIAGGRTTARVDLDDPDHGKTLDRLIAGFRDRNNGAGEMGEYEMRVVPRWSGEFVHVKG
jgi:hypothetical protein